MHRHRALAALSRDHHHVLALAEGLRKDGPASLRAALPADPLERARHVRGFFDAAMDPHFRLEEEVLFPAVRGRSAQLDDLIEGLLEEHALMRRLIDEILPAADVEESLDALARTMISHVRAEEREVFALVQEVLKPGELDSLAAALDPPAPPARGLPPKR